MGSFGPALRRTREEKGISLDEIAGETRLSKHYLLALEDEAIHKLPGGTYNRAYLRSYAGYLGLDTERLVQEYSLEEAFQTETGRLQQQPDVLASIGKVVEGRQTDSGRSLVATWVSTWANTWIDALADLQIRDRAGKTAILVGAGTVALLLLVATAWFVFRGASSGDSGGVEIAAEEHAAPDAAATADAAVARDSSDAPEPLPKNDPPPSAGAPDPAGAVRPMAPASAAAAPAAPAPSAPAPAAAAPAASAPSAGPADIILIPDKPAAAAASDRSAAADDSRPPAPASKTRASSRRGAGRRLSVTGSGVGTGVSDRKLVGESDTFDVGSRVTFWTRVAGGRPGDTVNHVWFRNGDRVGSTSLRIGGADWRTQSRQLIESGGQWSVEARDADGRVLARERFRTTTAQ